MAAYPNSLPTNLYQGVVKGITLEWADNIRGRLTIMPQWGGSNHFKAATEHLGYNRVTGSGKDRVG